MTSFCLIAGLALLLVLHIFDELMLLILLLLLLTMILILKPSLVVVLVLLLLIIIVILILILVNVIYVDHSWLCTVMVCCIIVYNCV